LAQEVGDAADTGGTDWSWKDALTGYTRHGTNQAISRDDHGVSIGAIKGALEQPVQAVGDVASRTTTFTGKEAVVVLNQVGKLITAWATNSSGWRYGGD
jgi:hypothetical protein